jgi:prepilin-type N-terminal cleavage/methylation domain-containing protein
MNNNKGFTLVELLVVIVILGVLAGLGIPSLLSLYNPLKNAAAAVDGKMNQMMLMGKSDPSRMYCIYTPDGYRKFVGMSRSRSAPYEDQDEPSLDFDLPEGIFIRINFAFQSLEKQYTNSSGVSSSFRRRQYYNAGYNCSNTDERRVQFREAPSDGSPSNSQGILSLNGALGGTDTVDFNYLVISRMEGDNFIDALIASSAAGQSKISYRKYLPGNDNYFIGLPNY